MRGPNILVPVVLLVLALGTSCGDDERRGGHTNNLVVDAGDGGADEDAPLVPEGDEDDDGIANAIDNCPRFANHSQADADGDGDGDKCDNCPGDANSDQADADGDGKGDVCDEDDTDRDGTPDRVDNCPAAANPTQSDGDDDGIGDVCDNCPSDPNFAQADADHDGIGDTCEDPDDGDGDGVDNVDDSCPDVANPDQADADDDGVGDVCDNCPLVPNFSQADADGDGVGDACVGEDGDGDGVARGDDNCPNAPNPSQGDGDNDGVGDVCDNCPSVPNHSQLDTDDDGVGDVCQLPSGDDDGDGVPNSRDNCPTTPNASQNDQDHDGLGDVCDPCVRCASGSCDGSGDCLDRCAGVHCPAGEVCSAADGRCYGAGEDCRPCESTDACAADEVCVNVVEIHAHYCGGPCEGGCPDGFDCVTLSDGTTEACVPEAGTCFDPCNGVSCGGGSCDPATGACPGCDLNTDCPADQYCDRNTHLCQWTGGSSVSTQVCATTADCSPGMVCEPASVFPIPICVTVCDTSEECADLGGFLCVASTTGGWSYCGLGL